MSKDFGGFLGIVEPGSGRLLEVEEVALFSRHHKVGSHLPRHCVGVVYYDQAVSSLEGSSYLRLVKLMGLAQFSGVEGISEQSLISYTSLTPYGFFLN